jgi:hypothetical protein
VIYIIIQLVCLTYGLLFEEVGSAAPEQAIVRAPVFSRLTFLDTHDDCEPSETQLLPWGVKDGIESTPTYQQGLKLFEIY